MSRAIALLAVVLVACGPSAATRAARCKAQGDQIIKDSASCPEALAGLKVLVKCSPDCAGPVGWDGGPGVHCGLTR